MSTSVAGLSTNYFPSPQSGFTTTTSGSVGSGAATVGLNSVAGYSNGEIAVFVIDPTDVSKKQTFTGVIDTSGSQVTSVKWTAGTNQTHALGATVVDYATATHISMMAKGILVEHNQDGTHGAVTATSLTTSGNATIGGSLTEAGAVHSTMRAETVFDHIASGCVWSGDAYASTRNASCTSGVVYLSGKRLTVAAVTARSFTASKDVYCDLSDNGDGTAVWNYTDGTTNAASPALTAGRVRGAIIVVGASSIAAATSVNQGQEDRVLPIASSIPYAVTDSLGNLICPRDPQKRLLGFRRIVSTFTAASSALQDITGLSTTVTSPGLRKLEIVVHLSQLYNSIDDKRVDISIEEDGVVIATAYNRTWSNPAGGNGGFTVLAVSTPSAGAHTYKARCVTSSGTPVVFAAATTPSFIEAKLA